MIRLGYAMKLARTKLRSKRGMLIASVAVASLLYAALIAGVIAFTGAEKSANEFVKEAGNDRYLVKARPNIPYDKLSFSLTPSLDEIREITAYEKQYYTELKERYAALGLEYSEESEVPALEPFAFADPALPEEQRVKINNASPVIQEMQDEKFKTYTETATNTFNDLKEVGAQYGADGYYIVDQATSLPPIPQLRLVQDDKEDFSASQPKTGGDLSSYGYYTNAIYNGLYNFTDRANLSRYLLTTDASELKGIPVVVSAQEAATLFGEKLSIGEEPEAANEKRSWLRDVQSKIKNQTYQACYRNSVEQSLLEKVQRDYAEIKNNEGNAEYQKPNLIYDYPEAVCGAIPIKEDTRTAAEKQAEADSEATQKKLGTYREPTHKLLTFQIVGVKHAQPTLDYTQGIEQYVRSLLTPNDQFASSSLEIPIEMYEALPHELKFDTISQREKSGTVIQRALANEDFTARVLEFTSAESARAFMNNETCSVSEETNCDKKYIGSPYGSNYLILDEISRLFSRIAAIAFPAVLGLAALIIWFTISRIMAENRKETAVYRAMGAKRRDVIGIYVIYVLLVSLLILAVSFMLGAVAAFGVDYFYGATLTDTAITSMSIATNDAPRFSLFNLPSPLLLVVMGSIFAVSLAASFHPLIRNTLRSPIHDIRDE